MVSNNRSITIMTNGTVVTAVAVEYADIVHQDQISSNIYEVMANQINDSGGDLGPRTITRIYTNDKLSLADEPTSGKYVIIELNSNDINSSTLYHKVLEKQNLNDKNKLAYIFNFIYDLEYTVIQKENIENAEGEIIPAGVITGKDRLDFVVDKFKRLVYENDNGKSLPYGLAYPDNYDPQKKYPMVLFLHGAGERGNNLVNIFTKGATVWAEKAVQSEHPCFVLAPQCPIESAWTNILVEGNQGGPFNPTVYLEMVHELVLELIDKYSIDKNRIYTTGLSMGGFGTWALNIAYPDTYAAVVPICGGGNPDKAEVLVDKPIWNFHAEDDSVVDISYSRDIITALREKGSDVIYTEYDRGVVSPPLAMMPHFSWLLAYKNKNMIEWMFSQNKEV